MNHQIDYTLPNGLVEQRLEAVPELMWILINNVMHVERSKYLQDDDYERTEEQIGHSNGYKPKTVGPEWERSLSQYHWFGRRLLSSRTGKRAEK